MTVSASLLIGAVVGAANAAAAVWTARRATALDADSALRVVLGGMIVRMFATLAAVAVVLALVPVHRGAFVAGLGALFVAGLLAESALVLRSSSRPPADA